MYCWIGQNFLDRFIIFSCQQRHLTKLHFIFTIFISLFCGLRTTVNVIILIFTTSIATKPISFSPLLLFCVYFLKKVVFGLRLISIWASIILFFHLIIVYFTFIFFNFPILLLFIYAMLLFFLFIHQFQLYFSFKFLREVSFALHNWYL